MEIRIIAFRGIGLHNTRFKQESGLIKAGHVGFQFEGDDLIYGFHPTQAAIQSAGGEEAILRLLIDRIPQPAALHDDTEIFIRAYELAQKGAPTTVLVVTYQVPDEDFGKIRDTALRWYNEGKQLMYNFPKKDGSFDADEANCAVFPEKLGIPIPIRNGKMGVYIDTMRQLPNVRRWQPKG